NSILELTLGYNGFGRLTGNETGSVGGLNGWGATGLTRLFGGEIGGQVAWLLPAALVLLAAGLWLTRRAPRTDRPRAALLWWGGCRRRRRGPSPLSRRRRRAPARPGTRWTPRVRHTAGRSRPPAPRWRVRAAAARAAARVVAGAGSAPAPAPARSLRAVARP